MNDFVLGAQVPFDSAAYRDYRCGPSEQFDGFTWCQKTRQGGERRGAFRVTQSMLHSRDGKITYINRQQDPVFFDGNDAEEDMRSFSRKIGSQPRVTKVPRRQGAPEGILALWGQVAIEPLDAESIKILADGKSPQEGLPGRLRRQPDALGAGRMAGLSHHRRAGLHLGRELRPARSRDAASHRGRYLDAGASGRGRSAAEAGG